MSDAKKLPRPPQVTLSGWVAIVGSVFVVFNAFEIVGNLRTIDHQERVTKTLGQEPFKGMGVSLEQALEVIRIAALVAGASATAAAILGIFVLQRDKSARLGLSVVAVPLFVAGLITGGFLSSMVAVCAVILWTKPARDWFNGIAAPPVERRTPQQKVWPPHQDSGQSGSQSGGQSGSQPSQHLPPGPISPGEVGGSGEVGNSGDSGDPGDGPRAWTGFGTSGASGQPAQPVQQTWQQQADQHRATQQQPNHQQPNHQAWPQQSHQAPVPRPTEVLRACLATWIASGTVAVGALLAVIAFVASPDMLTEMYEQEARFEESGLSVDQVRVATIMMAGVFIGWAVGAAALAVFVLRGQDWARVLLVISAACAGLLSLLMVIAAPFLLIVAAACGYAGYALTRKPVNDWIRDQVRVRREARRR